MLFDRLRALSFKCSPRSAEEISISSGGLTGRRRAVTYATSSLKLSILAIGIASMGAMCAELPTPTDTTDLNQQAAPAVAVPADPNKPSPDPTPASSDQAAASDDQPSGSSDPTAPVQPPNNSQASATPDDGLVQPPRSSSIPQAQLTPIARWDTVPHQRIDAGQTLNIGVVAFSRYGISRVRFIVSGEGYTGPSPIDVTKMTINDQTGVCEYWAPIKADDFTSDGLITVDAEVYGNDGGVRTKDTDGGGVGLDPLGVMVNPTGSLQTVQAWVSTAGNDGAAAVNSRSKPFGTIGKAIDAIRQYRASQGLGNNADGGIVRLMQGTHNSDNGGVTSTIACDYEWLTITTDDGGNPDNTTILSGGIPTVRKLHIQNVTLSGGGVLSMGDRGQDKVWADGCRLVGSGRQVTGSHPLGYEYGRMFYTDCSITQVQQATTGSALCRNLNISHIGDDAFQNVAMVVNCDVMDIDPYGSGAHADAWQHGMGDDSNKLDDNVIVYNLVATGLQYQSIFIRGDIYAPPSMADGMAFVNVYTEMNQNSYGYGGWGRWVNHLLWWHCTFATKGIGLMSDSYAGSGKYPCRITNWSVRGCDFAFFGDGGADADWSGWWDNHFVDPSGATGSNYTTGADNLDASGVPQDGSPLIDRMDVIVPVDANNKPRDAKADVGAFER